MSHSDPKPGGWTALEKMSSVQAGAVKDLAVNSVDKTVAGDTVSGVLTMASGAGVTLQSGAAIVGQAGSHISGLHGLSGSFDLSGVITTSAPAAIVLGANDYPALSGSHAGRTKVRTTPAASCAFVAGSSTWAPVIFTNTGLLGPVLQHTVTVGGTLYFILPNLHNRATLSTVDVWIMPNTTTRGAGALTGVTAPTLEIYRTAARANNSTASARVSLLSTTTASLAFPSYADYVGAKFQRLRYTCDQNNFIDTTQYSYYGIFSDESGANAVIGNQLTHVDLTFTAIADMAFA